MDFVDLDTISVVDIIFPINAGMPLADAFASPTEIPIEADNIGSLCEILLQIWSVVG